MINSKKKMIAAALAAGFILTMMGVPSPATAAPTVEVINVRDYGAVGNGTTDDSAAFQSAIAASTSQKRPVYVPYGTYKISQKLTLTDQLMFGEPSGSWSSDQLTLPTIRPASTSVSPIYLSHGGAISGLNFDYTQNETAAPTARPATVMLGGIGTSISNVRIHKAWIAIDTDPGASINTGRSVIQDVFISYVGKMGIHLDKGWDATTLNNVEVWTPNDAYAGYFLNNGTGLLLEHNDALRVTNTFVFGAAKGIHLRTGPDGSGTWGTLTNTSTDFCATGVLLEGSNHVTVAGGSFWSHFYAFNVQGAETRLNVSSADMKGNGAPALLVNDGSSVTVTSSTISRTNSSYGSPAVQIVSGWNVILDANYITGYGKGLEIGPNARRLIVSNNIIEPLGPNKVGVTNNAPASSTIVISDNVVL